MSHQNHKQEVQFSLTSIAAAVSAALVAPATAIAQDGEDEIESAGVLEEVIVTANKYEQNLQNIPASIQALPEEFLLDIGALNTEDYARFIPSMTFLNFSTAGSNQIIFRGVNTGTSNFIATASASIYLDEISLSQTGSQPDVRIYDVARVEALAGPQGTLFGAAAQSGTLRIITNQPNPSKFESNIDTMLRGGSDSDVSYNVTAMVNIPMVEDVFAIRIAAQTAEDGGFIDNVLGHTPDGWWGYGFPAERSTWGTKDNSEVAEKNWNSVDFTGARITGLWHINDNWSATLSYNYSKTKADAGNDYNPFVGDLETIQFNKNSRQDKWSVWGLTIEADLGFAQFVSATSYFDRKVEYNIDGTIYYKYYHSWGCEERTDTAYYYWLYTNPSTGNAIYYPQYCIMTANPTSSPLNLGDDIGVLQGPSWNDKLSQEFRLSHQGETIDWLAGFYYEDSTDNWDSVWMKSAISDYQDSLSLYYFENSPVGQPSFGCRFCYGEEFPLAEYAFLSTDRTDWKQVALFGEVTWHINDDWHATIGGRWFKTTNDKQYLKYHAGWTTDGGDNVGGHLQPGYQPGDGGEEIAHGKIDEFVPKFSLSWNISDDKMLYALYSQGFRTGGTNRSNGRANWDQTVFPQVWNPDKLKNYELGLKSRWAKDTVQLNVSWFYMDWTDYQIELVDPSGSPCEEGETEFCGNPWLKVVGNAGDAHSTGLQADFAWIPSENWDIGANAMWLKAEIDGAFVANPRPGREEIIPDGQPLPNSPEFKGAAWATYSWPVEFVQGGMMFVRGSYTYTGSSHSRLIPVDPCCSANPSFDNASYSIADLRFGLISTGSDWQVDFFISNLFDKRAQVLQQSGKFEWQFSRSDEYDHFQRIYTNRPREYGIRFTKNWGG